MKTRIAPWLVLAFTAACGEKDGSDTDDTDVAVDTGVIDTGSDTAEYTSDTGADTSDSAAETGDTAAADADADGVLDAQDACPGEDDDLDDDANGTPDCEENLLDNGQFRAGITAWSAESPATAVFGTDDHDGDAASGSVQVTNSDTGVSPSLFGVAQCVPVTASTSYIARARAYLASGQGATGGGTQLVVVPHTSADCTTGDLSPRTTSISQVEDSWQLLSVTFDAGVGAQSARVSLRVRKNGNDGAVTARFDNVLVRQGM